MTVLEGVTPALPLHAAGKYVAGAYVVFVLVILIYVTIMAIRLGRMERALVELNHDLTQRDALAEAEADPDHDAGREPARLSTTGRTAGDSSL
jgi:hypothetical protein